jgi:hypothetical protein
MRPSIRYSYRMMSRSRTGEVLTCPVMAGFIPAIHAFLWVPKSVSRAMVGMAGRVPGIHAFSKDRKEERRGWPE